MNIFNISDLRTNGGKQKLVIILGQCIGVALSNEN